jgi:hypothetical protein
MDKNGSMGRVTQNRNHTSQKGFLKDKDYQPGGDDHYDSDRAKHHRDTQSRTGPVVARITKPPRPDQYSEKEQIKATEKMSKTEKKQKRELNAEDRKYRTLKITVIIVGTLILLVSILISYQNFLTYSDPEPTLEEKQYHLLNDIVYYQPLQSDPAGLNPTWDLNSYLTLTSAELEEGIKTDLNYIIEVEDISSYPYRFNRTLENGLSWNNLHSSSDPISPSRNAHKTHSLVNIQINSNEVHLAKVVLTAWG